MKASFNAAVFDIHSPTLSAPVTPPREKNVKFSFTHTGRTPEIEAAVAYLLDCPQFKAKTAKKRKETENYLWLILNNLLEAYAKGIKWRVSFSRDRSFYSRNGFRTDKKNNPFGVSYRIVAFIDALQVMGLVSIRKGFINEWEAFWSRMQPTEKFARELVQPFNLIPVKCEPKSNPVYIKLKVNGKEAPPEQARIPFPSRYENECKAFNALLEKTVITRQPLDPSMPPVPIHDKHYHRVFHEDMHGRGGYYSSICNISKEERRYLLLDGQKVIELDYTAQHLGFAYGLEGIEMPDSLRSDPYSIGVKGQPRSVIKACVVRSLNCQTPRKAWLSVKGEHPALTYSDYQSIMQMFLGGHVKGIEKCLYNKTPPDYIHLGAIVAEDVIRRMVAQGTPVLPIHDSFIARVSDKDALLAAMKAAYLDSPFPFLNRAYTTIKDTGGNIHRFK